MSSTGFDHRRSPRQHSMPLAILYIGNRMSSRGIATIVNNRPHPSVAHSCTIYQYIPRTITDNSSRTGHYSDRT